MLKTFSLPPVTSIDPNLTIPDLVRRRHDRDPDAPMVEIQDDAGHWHPLSAAEVVASVKELAAGLLAAGIGAGVRVGILGRTSWHWTRIDLALWWIGAVSVPIYESSSLNQAIWIAQDAGLSAVFTENVAHRQLML